jgi:elongation factor G
MDDRFGALTFTRIYSGTIKKGDTHSQHLHRQDRAGRPHRRNARRRPDRIESAQAGDIVALVGMKNVQTGHTLCDPKNPATLEPMVFPDPVISIAVQPKDKGDNEKMGMARSARWSQRIPSFQVETDEESGETIIKGMGELHLDIKVDILKRTHGVEVEVGKPQVAYRETITKPPRRQLHPQEAVRWFGSVRKIDYTIEPASRVKASPSSPRSPAATCRRNTGRRSRRASKPASTRGRWPASPPRLEGDLTDGGFHAVDSSPWPSRLRPRRPIASRCPRPSPSSSSRS